MPDGGSKMKLSEQYALLIESEIYRMVYMNQVVGYRVKRYVPESNQYEYYDFDLTMVQALPQLWKFFQSIEGKCKSKGLYPSGNGLFSKEELDGVYASKNISDVRMAQTILQPVILLYLRGYKNG